MNQTELGNGSLSFNLKLDVTSCFAEITFQGYITIELIRRAFLKLIEHPLFKKNMDVCYDYSKAIIETNICDVDAHSQFVFEYAESRGSSYKLAFVSNETLNSALLNIYKLKISKTNIDVKLFGSKKQAYIWLEKKVET